MSSKPARKPKSQKADGTPKKRWSAAERAARGVPPRRGGGRSRTERDGARTGESGPRGAERSHRFDRDDRAPRRLERDDRGPRRFERDDRGPRRLDGDDRRPPRFERDDRPRRDDGNRFDREDRAPRRFDNDNRGPRRFDNDNRAPRRFERDDRGPRRLDGDDRRPPRFERDDRPRRDDRNRFDRDDRSRGTDRDARGSRDAARTDRRPPWGRDERPARDDRPVRNERSARDDRRPARRDDRPGREDRRPAWGREDRPRARRWEDRGPRRDDRRRDDRGPRRDDRRRDDRNFQRDDRPRWDNDAAPESDQMDWAAPELDAEALTAAEAALEEHHGIGFADLGVPHGLVRALGAQGITEPFPIQRATIPDAIAGRDVLGRGRTGSGKTLGFGLPMLTRLTGRDHVANAPGAVVLVPTRELAMQVADVLSPLAREVGLSVQLVAGGMAYAPQVRALERGVDVLVATPGRLIDLMDQGAADLTKVQITVLDEADHMADLGFLPDVQTILGAVPDGGQRMLFSATLDRGVGGLVRDYLHDPVTHEVDSAQASVTTMTHHLVHVAPADKVTITAEIANRQGRSVLFVRTQRGADRIAEQLREAGVMAGALHGGLTQGARSRMLGAFKAGTVPVLVATDVAARGIHVDDVGLVLQVDPPADSKDYLHRAGRTARAGEDGAVVTLVLPHQRRQVGRLVQRAGVSVQPVTAGPDDEALYRATGARRPSGDPIDEQAFADLIAPPPARPRRGGGRSGGRGFHRGRGYGRR